MSEILNPSTPAEHVTAFYPVHLVILSKSLVRLAFIRSDSQAALPRVGLLGSEVSAHMPVQLGIG